MAFQESQNKCAHIAYKFRLYPNETQKKLINKTFGCVRYVYNACLNAAQEVYQKDKTYFSYTQMAKELTELKTLSTHSFLKDVDAIALQQSIRHLDNAYQNFYKNPKHFHLPKFKSRKSRQSYTTTKSGTVLDIKDNYVKLPKIGLVKIVKHRDIPHNYRLLSAVISRENDNSFYVSLQYEYNLFVIPYRPITKTNGLDYKSDGFYCDKNGYVVGSPKYYRQYEKQLSHWQRQLSRQVYGSANWTKTKSKIADISRRIANCRKDFIEKESTRLINEYDLISVETLNMQAMANKGFGNGKSTLDNGYGMFVNRLMQKAVVRGKVVIKVDKWFPSSQLCSVCGYQNSEVKNLIRREWVCPKCGTLHDRDTNAGINIDCQGLLDYYDSLETIGVWNA